MGRPTADDPLGERDPEDNFTKGLEKLIDERIRHVVRGRSSPSYNGHSDLQLVTELIARGWAVFKPSTKG
jgi:hypothetical protein